MSPRMSPNLGGTAARARRAVCPLTLSVAMTMAVPGLAQAEPEQGPNSLSALVGAVADANQRLQDISAQVQTEQESVNKAIVEVQEAREAAASAQHEVDASRLAVKDANAAITDAQKKFDVFAASTYINGPSASLVLARTPDEIISTASAGQTLALSSQQVMAGLERARTDVVNKDASARLAKDKADQAVLAAKTTQDSAVEALKGVQQSFRQQQVEIDRLAAERKDAQRKLEAARAWSAPATPVPAALPPSTGGGAAAQAAPPAKPSDPASGDRWEQGAAGSGPSAAVKVPYGKASEWDLTLPAIPSAFLSGDPVQIINAILQIAQNSMQVTQDLGKQFLQQLGILKPTDTGITNGGGIPMVYGNQAIEYVIKRAQSQLGVPYSWGGGTANGPSYGIDEGSGTVGLDCSGLILYAFAGAGIKLPHYSGSQYQMGRQIPASQMRRGDVIFYGPGGSQHVTLYLGNNQMIEAPYTGATVRIAPVRTGGMTPFVVRYIEW